MASDAEAKGGDNVIAFRAKPKLLPEVPLDMIAESLAIVRAACGGDSTNDARWARRMYEYAQRFRSEPGNAAHALVVSEATVTILDGMLAVIIEATGGTMPAVI